MAQRIGFIGLGDMGGRIAQRILDSGFALTVFDVRSEPVEELVSAGAHSAAVIGDLVERSDIICLCVVDDTHVDEVLAQFPPNLARTVVIHSSVLPQTVQRIAQEQTALRVVDAPVSGSRPAADAGTLTVLVGAEEAHLDAVRVLFAAYASNVVHAGPVGAGQILKIANNMMLHMNHLIAIEAARFARAHSISEALMMEAVNLSSGASWVTRTWPIIDDMLRDHPLAGSDQIYPIMSKEMWHAVEMSRDDQTALPLTALGVHLSRGYLEERERLMSETEAGPVPVLPRCGSESR